MSPRPAVTRHDQTAVRLLTALAELIDQSMDPTAGQHPRLRSIRFPVALDWIRIEDVLRTAARQPEGTISKKALVNRWETREEFLRDGIVFAMLYQDDPAIDAVEPSDLLMAVSGSSFTGAVSDVVERLYAGLMAHPRSFLLCQFAPYFGLHPGIAAKVAAAGVAEQLRWTEVYATIAAGLPVELRPEWSAERAGMALQCLLDGFVMRHRINPTTIAASSWSEASLLADTVLALLVGMLDLGGDASTAREYLDHQLLSTQPPKSKRTSSGGEDLIMVGA